MDAWAIRQMISFGMKRQRDSVKRGQIPGDSRLSYRGVWVQLASMLAVDVLSQALKSLNCS